MKLVKCAALIYLTLACIGVGALLGWMMGVVMVKNHVIDLGSMWYVVVTGGVIGVLVEIAVYLRGDAD